MHGFRFGAGQLRPAAHGAYAVVELEMAYGGEALPALAHLHPGPETVTGHFVPGIAQQTARLGARVFAAAVVILVLAGKL